MKRWSARKIIPKKKKSRVNFFFFLRELFAVPMISSDPKPLRVKPDSIFKN